MKQLLSLFFAGLSVFVAQFASADITSPLAVNQWVQPTENGKLVGRIVIPMTNGTSKAVENAVVSMVDQDGNLITCDAKTNAKGEFSINGVAPGIYALSVRADYVFAAVAMHVVDSDLVGPQSFPTQAEIAAANVDFTTVKMAMIRYMPPSTNEIISLSDSQVVAVADQVTGEHTFRVAQTNGGLKGRLNAPGAIGGNLNGAQLTNVFIMKNGQEVARTVTTESGEFTIEQLDAGAYSLMAIGPQGLGLIGFELVDPTALTQNAQVSANGKHFVFRLPSGEACSEELTMQIAPVIDTATLTASADCNCKQAAPAPVQSAPMQVAAPSTPVRSGGALSGGGSGGGAGALSGGRGLRGLIGLAGVGTAIAVTTTSDDDAVAAPAATTPVAPN